MDDKYAITDSTDWANTATPSLGLVDAALRCQVCKDFFDAAVITSCAHTFCSKCIRRAISADGKCPACRSTTQEHALRRNVTVQELVDAFQIARPETIELALKTKSGENDVSETRGSKRKRQEAQLEDQHPRTRGLRKRTKQSPQTDVMVIDDSENEEAVYIPEDDEPQLEDGLVSCPICNIRMKEEAVYTHLDKCNETFPSEPPRKSTTPQKATPISYLNSQAGQPVKPPERLARLNYSLIKDQELKRKLSDLGISSTGSKDQMIRRHKEWVNLCNSNWDSLHPRSKRDLLGELALWERTQGGNASIMRSSATANADMMNKDFDCDGWAKQNKPDFDILIANARKAKAEAKAKAENAIKEEVAGKTGKAEEDFDRSMPNSLNDISNLTSRTNSGSLPTPGESASPRELRPPSQPGTTTTKNILPSLSPTTRRLSISPTRTPCRRTLSSTPVPGFSIPKYNLSPTITVSPTKTMPPPLKSQTGTASAPEDPGDVGPPLSRAPSGEGSMINLSKASSMDEHVRSRIMSREETSLPGLFTRSETESGGGLKRVHMFEVPEQPVVDADSGSAR